MSSFTNPSGKASPESIERVVEGYKSYIQQLIEKSGSTDIFRALESSGRKVHRLTSTETRPLLPSLFYVDRYEAGKDEVFVLVNRKVLEFYCIIQEKLKDKQV